MYILLLAAAASVRGQLDAGLRSRIRFPPQLPGRHVVWEAVWESKFHVDLTPSPRRLLDGVAMPVPHRSPSQDGRAPSPSRRRLAENDLVKNCRCTRRTG